MIEKFACADPPLMSELLDLNHTSISYESRVPFDSEFRYQERTTNPANF